MIRVDETAMSEWIDIEIERLERLLADLKRIRSRAGPTAADLDGTPVIDGYRIARRDVLCLVGEVTGHPRLGNRKALPPSPPRRNAQVVDFCAAQWSEFAPPLTA